MNVSRTSPPDRIPQIPLHTGNQVILLAFAFPPENISGAKRPFRFAKYLPQHGYNVSVITASGNGEGGSNIHTAPHVGDSSGVKHARTAAAFIQRWFMPYNDQLPWVPAAVASAERILTGSQVAAVISTSPPVGAHMAAAYLQRRHGIKWIADLRDPIHGNPWRNRRFSSVYNVGVERYLVTHADAVIANTDIAADALRARYPAFASKILLLWNGYDPDEIVSPRLLPGRNYVTLTHCGVIGGRRHPGQLIDAMERMITRGVLAPDRMKLQLVGPLDVTDPWVGASAFHRLLERGCIEYTGQTVPETVARTYMAEADYLLLIDAEAGIQLPAKIFDYVRIGRPILALSPSTSPAVRILKQSGLLHTCIHPADSPVNIETALLAHLQLSREPRAPSAWFTETFAGSDQTAALAKVLDSLLGCPQR